MKIFYFNKKFIKLLTTWKKKMKLILIIFKCLKLKLYASDIFHLLLHVLFSSSYSFFSPPSSFMTVYPKGLINSQPNNSNLLLSSSLAPSPDLTHSFSHFRNVNWKRASRQYLIMLLDCCYCSWLCPFEL